MNQRYLFRPATGAGLALHAGLILLLLGGGIFALWRAVNANIGPQFVLYLLPALACFSLVPVLGYNAYALYGAFYLIEREGMRLRWGWRMEDIPVDEVIWVRQAAEIPGRLRRPLLSLPGAVVGLRRTPGMGEVEFLSGSYAGLVLVATSRRVFAISPEDPEEFLRMVRRLGELGSLSPVPWRSQYPSFLLARFWAEGPARWLAIAAVLLSLVLLVVTSLAIPRQELVFLGFTIEGQPRDWVPSVRLLLLPVVNLILVLADLLAGLFFFRRPDSRLIAYLLWCGGVLTPLFFLTGLWYILRAI